MAFKKILENLTIRTGAAGAILLDFEGEAIDCFSTGTDLELDMIGAHNSIILNMLREVSNRQKNSGEVETVGISTAKTKLALSTIKDGYYLLVAMDIKKPFGRAFFESKKAVVEILKEIG